MSDRPPKRLLKSEWLFPAAGPLERACGVVISNDRIVAVGDAKSLQRDHPDAEPTDFGAAIILPGLVNPHTHLELSNCDAGHACGLPFADWILTIPSRAGTASAPPEQVIPRAVQRGVEQCIRFGVTSVGDIAKHVQHARTVLRDAPIRSVSYGETLGLAKARPRYERQLADALDRTIAGDRLRIGLSPHAPYSVDLPSFQQCIRIARQLDLPLTTHLAETPDEQEFLQTQRGVFRAIWEKLGMWEDGVVTFDGSPIAFAEAAGLLDYPTLLAHVNYCDDEDLARLVKGRASVAYCPRTHRYFGHPPHRWREMLARGINVTVGTDSCASSPDLNVVDELRLLHEIAPQAPANELWQMATIRAARALLSDKQVGSIEPGKFADFAVFDVTTDQPLTEILESNRLPRETWIAGERITPPAAAAREPAG